MDLEKADNRNLQQIEQSVIKTKRSISVLMNALNDTIDLKQEVKHSLIKYIIGA